MSSHVGVPIDRAAEIGKFPETFDEQYSVAFRSGTLRPSTKERS
jgi:hypothetical protein